MDDFNFFGEPGESGADIAPETHEVETPTQAPEPQTVSVEQFNDLQQRLEASERWKQDFGRMVAQNTGVLPPEQNQQTRESILADLIQNPLQFQQQTIAEATRLARQEMEQQAIIQDRRAKHPELAAMEPFIDWQAVMQQAGQQFYQKNNRQPSFAEVIDASIELMKPTFQGLSQSSQSQQQGAAATRMAMNLNLTGGQSAQGQGPNIAAMSNAEWVAFRDAKMRQIQGY